MRETFNPEKSGAGDFQESSELLDAEEEARLASVIQAGLESEEELDGGVDQDELRDTAAKGRQAQEKLVASQYALGGVFRQELYVKYRK